MRNINDECYGPQLPSETPSTDIHSHTYYQLWGAGQHGRLPLIIYSSEGKSVKE